MDRRGETRIKGILFDVDGTLYHQTPLRLIMMGLLVLCHLNKPTALKRKLKIIVQYRRAQEVLRKAAKRQKQCHLKQLALTVEATGETSAFVSEVVTEWFEQRPLPFITLCRRRGMERAMDTWQKNGLRLGIYSDYPAIHKINALGIAKYISILVSPEHPEIEGFKPNSNGFTIAAREIGLNPAQMLYVGDRPEVDGQGAVEAGMQVVILRGRFARSIKDYAFCRSFSNLMNRIPLG